MSPRGRGLAGGRKGCGRGRSNQQRKDLHRDPHDGEAGPAQLAATPSAAAAPAAATSATDEHLKTPPVKRKRGALQEPLVDKVVAGRSIHGTKPEGACINRCYYRPLLFDACLVT